MPLHKLQRRWFDNAVGRTPNPDHVAGLQCVDVPKDYAEDIFPGVPWQNSTGAGNAKDMFANANPAYFRKIRNNPNRPNLLPKKGDVIIWGGTGPGGVNPYGHIATCWSAFPAGTDVYQMDGFLQVPIFRDRLGWNNAGTGMVTGWTRPRRSRMPGPAAKPSKPKVKSYQRLVGKNANVAYRKQASSNGKLIQWLQADHIYDFKGYVHGEAIGQGKNKNDIWFVGRYSEGLAWSGGFTNASTKGLKDLTPTEDQPAKLEPYQRVTGKVAVSYRKGPSTAHGLMDASDGLLAPDHKFDFDAWTHGQPVTDTDTGKKNGIWFRGRYSKGWAWSGGFTSQSTKGLKFIKTEDQADPADKDTAPKVPETYEFEADLSCVTEVSPARVGHFQADGMPDEVLDAFLHQYGALENHRGDTIDGVVAWFQSEDNDGLTSAHFAVQGKRIVQLVALKDRAYHAGAGGNDGYGIEIDPEMDDDTIASVRLLLKQLAEHDQRVHRPRRHNEVSNTECGKDVDLADFRIKLPLPDADKAPNPDDPEEPQAPAGTIDQFLDWWATRLKSDYRKAA